MIYFSNGVSTDTFSNWILGEILRHINSIKPTSRPFSKLCQFKDEKPYDISRYLKKLDIHSWYIRLRICLNYHWKLEIEG